MITFQDETTKSVTLSQEEITEAKSLLGMILSHLWEIKRQKFLSDRSHEAIRSAAKEIGRIGKLLEGGEE